jgi:SAM-dependent methyltransferase
MRFGDFTLLASKYVNRPGYSPAVLGALARYVGRERPDFRVADIGAGTGKLTELLAGIGLEGYAVEPNAAMRSEGVAQLGRTNAFTWLEGCAEETRLAEGCVDWVCMASSFHWVEANMALREFRRILRPWGFVTVMWNPREIEADALQTRIEERIRQIVPDLKRRSSGHREYTQGIEGVLRQDGIFGDVLFVEAPHFVRMSHDRYIGVWESVNDIRVQAGEERWKRILDAIESEISGLDEITVHYRTRAWTVRVLDA